MRKVILCLIIFISACSADKGDSNIAAVNETPSVDKSAVAVNEVADTIFTNGKIYTVEVNSPWVEAVAVKDGVYIGLGKTQDIVAQYSGSQTQVIDLQGKMAMPGINDAHTHLYGGLKELYYCNFPASSNLDQIKAILQQCVADNPEQEFILGGYWASSFFDENKIESPKGWLDAISSDIPIIISDDSGHNGWVNSKALEVAEFTKDTKDPVGGTIVRNSQGEPNGLLYETVAEQIEAFFTNRWSDESIEKGMWYSINTINKYGITGIKDASTRLGMLNVMSKMDKNQGLTAHVAAALFTPYGHRDETLDYEKYLNLAKEAKTENLHTHFIKFFLDGVPTSSRSAAMLEAYIPDANHILEHAENRGMLHLSGEMFANDLIELDKQGFIIKIHAAGDRSVREALDAIEKVRQANGNTDKMHEIAHAGFISDPDLPRFRELNVAADISPYLWFPSPIIDNIISVLGERGKYYWPNLNLMNDGAIIIAGSDWPSVSPTANPWPGIEATVTRRNPYGEADGEYWPEQKLSLDETLKIFTVNGALALDLADKTGSISVGKYADLIVLEENLFEIAEDDISETKVLQTWFKGKQVWSAK